MSDPPTTSARTARRECELSIVMPCLNEAETVETCIKKAQTWLESSHCDGEILVADNGSSDGSLEIAERCGARVIRVPMPGYGAALYFGSRAAVGRFIIVGDSDDSYDFSNLSPFLDQLREGTELVMGNRFSGGIKPGAMPWKNRYIGNPILSWVGRRFFHSPARDFHCGLRGYSRDAFERMDLRTTGMEFASEMVIKATLLRLRISEVPTVLSPDGRSRAPHLRPWRDGWRHLRFMLLYSPRWLFLYPGALLAAAGLLGGGWLLGGPRRVGPAALDVHTLLYAAVAVLLGYQAALFAVFARVFAMTHGLLPIHPRMERIFRHVNLETGLAVGLTMLMAGLAASLGAFLAWRSSGYGPLSVQHSLRLVIPAALSITVGTQTIFASFFLSVLGLGVRRIETPFGSTTRKSVDQ
jgi:glycosyltransferase involved in cell wall biosynthesis